MAFNSLLDPVLRPLLSMNSFLAIFLISLFITLCVTLVYKYTTDQARMRELRKKVNEYQEKMRKAKDNPEKVLKLQREAMGFNMELMKHSFKPTLYTLIPIILIFGWLNAHMGYYNLAPGVPFSVRAELADGYMGNVSLQVPEGLRTLNSTRTANAQEWTLAGDAGTYTVTLSPENAASVDHTILVSERRDYAPPVALHKDGVVKQVAVGNEAVRPLGALWIPNPFDWSDWRWYPGWLGTYILLSVGLSMGLRKLLNVV